VILLAVFAAVGAVVKPRAPADKHFADPSVAYTFSYPGYWSAESPEQVAVS